MYDELVKRLRGRAESFDYDGWTETASDYEKAADAIEELQADKAALNGTVTNLLEQIKDLDKPRWIPVTERLPECDLGAEVGNIEWISCGMVHAGCFGRGGKYRDAYFRTWTDSGEGMDAKDADYWRAVTLPQPPKADCPLVPVPPHGRLVDADRLLSEHMKQKYYHLPNGDIAIPIIDVEHAPAVIETEEVYGQYTDTAGNFHWCGTHSGEHTIKAEEGET